MERGAILRKLLDVARLVPPEMKAFRQVFEYETEDERATVASALRGLNARPRLLDIEGNEAAVISWECSCLQKKCGACAMIINGLPRLACDTRLAELAGERVTLDPLAKFPVVADLVVDRDAVFTKLRDMGVWHDNERSLLTQDKASDWAYEATRCLQCGCCLEVCPNYVPDAIFGGMAAMNPMARLLEETPKAERKRLARSYKESVFGGCAKALVCRNICPANIDIDRLLSRANARAVWGRH